MNLVEATEKNVVILKEKLRKHQEDIKMRKARKLKRDGRDYLAGRVFTFASKFDHLINKNVTGGMDVPIEIASNTSSRSASGDSESNTEHAEGTSDSGNNRFWRK